MRYCLKSGRSLFDDYGMQVASFGQQPVVLADPDQIVWQTMFTIEAKMTDHWIANEYVLDDSGPLTISVVAVPAGGETPQRVEVNDKEE